VSERAASISKAPPLGWIVLGGVGALLLRTELVSVPGGQRVLLLAALYGSIAVASAVAPLPRSGAVLGRPIVLALGLAGVAMATVTAGPVVPAPLGPWSIPLAMGGAVAEELLFRRVTYGRLERYGPTAAVAGSAIAFAMIHVPLYGLAALPVDVGAGLLFSWQRWAAGTWSVPAATHAAANLLAVMLR
jgi:membrane protease YdiL (CAAX protease family)